MSIVNILPDQLLLTRECAESFFRESKLDGSFNWEHWTDQWKLYLEEGFGVFLAAIEKSIAMGIIGGVCVRSNMTGDLELIESFWYVLPRYRDCNIAIKLLKSFEKCGKDREAKLLKMAHLADLNPDRMAKFYIRFGFKPLEIAYVKSI